MSERMSLKRRKELEAALRVRLFAADSAIDCQGYGPKLAEGGTIEREDTQSGVVLNFKGAKAVCTVTVIPWDEGED